MDRINGAGHVNHRFVTEDAATNRPPTEITVDWLNGVQEEIVGTVEASGQTPDVADNLQLFKGVKKIFRKFLGAVSAAGGTADAITAAYDPVISDLVDGLELEVRYTSTNATTTPTFTPNNGVVPAYAVVKGNNVALVAGDIPLRAKLKWDATLTKWVLLNPNTPAATVTSANDATYADNSSKPASTGWMRGAMASIAIAAGFAYSFGSSGYIKFPSWLAGWIVQWGNAQTSAGGSVVVNFPIAYPTGQLRNWVSLYTSIVNSQYFIGSDDGSSTQMTITACQSGGAGVSVIIKWLSVGR